MGEVITLQVGQCGNQIGAEFWDRLCAEHGLSSDGTVASEVKDDRKEVFFYEADDGRYLPRAVLVDLEPRVVGAVLAERKGLYNTENVFLSNDGGGAGNNWADGYRKGEEHGESVMDIVRREAECSDLLDGFFLTHSISGGTGAGLGSRLLEKLREEFGTKKQIQSFSVLPNNESTSDVVVQPYNAVLSLQRLAGLCDGVIAMDNGALERVAGDALRVSTPTFVHTNRLAAAAMTAATCTSRFPGSRFSDFSSVLSAAVPLRSCHFFIPSYSPFAEPGFRVVRKTSCLDVQRRLFLPKTRLVSHGDSEANCFLSAVNIMSGATYDEVEKSVLRLKQNGLLRFAPWAVSSLQVALCRPREGGRVTGLLLGNNTGFAGALEKTCDQFDKLKAHGAFMEIYKKEGMAVEEFGEARDAVQDVIEKYRGCVAGN